MLFQPVWSSTLGMCVLMCSLELSCHSAPPGCEGIRLKGHSLSSSANGGLPALHVLPVPHVPDGRTIRQSTKISRTCEAPAIMRWHRAGFTTYWRWKSQGRPGRPRIEHELRDLIRRMSKENPMWGAPRIHGELLKLGFEVA
jgi:hypothetical protein